MPPASDTSDLRALARVILDREDEEQALIQRPRYDLHPVSRRFEDGARTGLVVGLTLGLASTGVVSPGVPHTPHWFVWFALFTASGTTIGACWGALIGLGVRASQRRQLDRELALLVDEPPR
jgi:hypothetical protein